MNEPIKCTKDNCSIVVKAALLNGFYARCETCEKTAGIATTEDGAIAVWNRWVEIGGFIKAKERER